MRYEAPAIENIEPIAAPLVLGSPYGGGSPTWTADDETEPA